MSAGILLYRLTPIGLEVLLAHPGGPFYASQDAGIWGLPKGLPDPGEDLLSAARREFAEETGLVPAGPFLPLGEVMLRSGKVVHGWACQGEAEPRTLVSNTFTMEWPPRSGRQQEFPEVDLCAWFRLAEARRRINPAQAVFLDRLEAGVAVQRQPRGESRQEVAP
ncbi:MAG: NUDIX domain-containing protein [Chloroflexota bacterium]|nr:NUDIX domain-containing protein [Chloroflexota bacterium]